MRTFILLFASIISVCNSLAQKKCDCFDRLYNLSNTYYLAENWEMAAVTLKDAIAFLEDDQKGDYYYAIGENYVQLNNPDSSKLYFSKAIEYGYPAKWVRQNYPSVFEQMDIVAMEQYTERFIRKINWDVYEKFVQLLAVDQSVRDGTLFPEKDIFHGTPEKKAFIDTLSRRIDSISAAYLISFLKRYGSPSSYKLGFYPSGFMALLLHVTAADNSNSRKLLDLLEEMNATCDFPRKSVILFLKDRQKLYKENKSCCGLSGGTLRYSSIEYPDIADSIRLENNQIRLQEELAGNEATLLKVKEDLLKRGYKPKPYPENYFCIPKYRFE